MKKWIKKKEVRRGIKYVLIFLVAYILISFFVILIKNQYKETKEYSENPKNWVSKKGDITSIDVSKISTAYVEHHGTLQQFNDGDINTAFYTQGWYNGEYFTSIYKEDDIVILSVGTELNSNDNVLDVFISEVFEDGNPYFDIFLDEKWKETFGKVNMWYGAEFDHYAEFDFSKSNEIKKGVYHNRIEDDINRFGMNSSLVQHRGGLLVGNLHRDDWINGESSEGRIVILFN